MQAQRTLNSQNNFEKEEQILRYYAPWLKIVLQSYRDQNQMVPAQKQT